MADTVDLTLIRYRDLDRKVSDLLDKLATLTDFVYSLDGHIAQLHKDRRRHEVDLAAVRNEISKINLRLGIVDE
jgi:hypothetical protein